MLQRKYETIVGVFVVGSLAALLLMVLIIAQQERLWQEHVEYHAIFKNVGGLKGGSEVRLAGVTVGNVKEVTVTPQGNILVKFEVVGKYRDQVRQDSRASIGFIGLLGEKSLDLTAGSADKPVIPPEGLVTSIEPLDMTELFARAAPSLENIHKILSNLATLSQELMEPESDFNKFLGEIRGIVSKVNQGKGSLGLVLNDPGLYQESKQSMTSVRKFVGSLEESKGLAGTLLNDPSFKAEAQKTLADLQATFANLRQVTGNLKDTAARLPELTRKGEAFLDHLNRAGAGLPELVVSGQEMVSDADKVAKAAQKSWLLRRNLPQPQEQTIRVERNPGEDKE